MIVDVTVSIKDTILTVEELDLNWLFRDRA
jgi:hypothetical protein